VIFTSGATESLNLAIQGTLNALTPLSQLGLLSTHKSGWSRMRLVIVGELRWKILS
jgi:cysteine sulfinate desulfinase/cysteine desulfurase-like protein